MNPTRPAYPISPLGAFGAQVLSQPTMHPDQGLGQFLDHTNGRAPLVPLAVDDMNRNLEALAASVSTLETRLGSVLRPEAVAAGVQGGASQPRSVAPPLVESLRTVSDGIEACRARIQFLAQRLEV
jgi:hypothetical protein